MDPSNPVKRTNPDTDASEYPLKRVSPEDLSALDEIDQVLNQPLENIEPGADMNLPDIDFNDLPEDLLDSVDASVATPEVSRVSTPVIEERRTRPKRQAHPVNLQFPPIPPSSQQPQNSQLQTPTVPQTHQSQTHQSQTHHPQAQSLSQPLHTNDPTKLNDALAAAGVDIQQEEDILMQQRINRSQYQYQYQQDLQYRTSSTFLNPYHVNGFMQKSAREHGVVQNFLQDPELLELVSASCEKWIADVVTKTLVVARHRQKSAPIGKGRASGKSDLFTELRNLAKKHRELEERRVERRITLELENSDENKDESKAGAEETLHRAANATAAMMTTGKKKYSWMTSGGGGGSGIAADTKDSSNKRSHLLAQRGDNGIRLNNTRITQAVTMKDLLSAIEDERMGVSKVIVKGYSKLRD